MKAPWQRHALTLLVLSAASAAWSWPTARHLGEVVVMRHFDLWSLLWLVGDAPDIGLDLFTEQSCWPEGQSLLRSDSLLVLILGGLLGPLVGPDALVLGLVLLG